ncbi:MAG: lipopolysaccharide biosynthesis protein [Solirubrobacterales bacterium]
MRMPTQLSGLRAQLLQTAHHNRALLTNAGSMVGTTLVTSALGVAFWLVAAHSFSQAAVGVASAAVAAMTLLGFMGTLGLGTLLMGDLPRRADGHHSLLNAALLINVAAGAVLGLVFALIAPLVSSNLGAIGESLPSTAFFAAGVSLTALAFVLDQALIGLLQGGLQLVRNVVFAVVKLLALIPIAVLVTDAGAPWIYSAWTAGICLSLVVLVRFYARRDGDSLRPNFALLMKMRVSAASHAAVNLALETADLAMPILVIVLLSASANAAFYIAWMIAGFLVMVPLSLSMVAYAIGSADAAGLSRRFRFTFAISLGFGVIANLVLIPAASPALQVFGQGYADQATTALHVLALGVFPLTIKTHYVAIHRVHHRLRSALPIVWGGTLLELGGGAAGAIAGGLTGVAWGWLAGLCIEGLVMGRDVFRGLRPDRAEAPRAVRATEELAALTALDARTFERP